MLTITGDGRKSALDMRMVDPNAEDDPESKLNHLAREVARIYHASRDAKSTQMISMDIREGAGGFDAYADVRRKLIRLGVPKEQIAFVQDYAKGEAKQGLFNQMNEGNMAVLFGSSDTLGVGVNIQKRLAALHMAAPPWRPDQVEQTIGRAIRFGNTNKEVLVRNYVTKKSFDAYMWHIIAKKNEFRSQFMKGDPDVRTIEDVSGRTMNAEEMEAAAADDPRLFKKMELESSVAKLESLARSFNDARMDNKYRLARLPEQIEGTKKHIAEVKKDEELWHSKPETFGMVVGKKHYDDRKEAGTALNAAVEVVRAPNYGGGPQKVGEFAGFDIVADPKSRNLELRGNVDWQFNLGQITEAGERSPMGTVQSMTSTLNGIGSAREFSEDRLSKLQKELTDRKAKLGGTFDKQDALDKQIKELADLNKSLGLDKAESQNDSVAIEAPEEKEDEEDEDEGPSGTTTMSFMGVQNAYEAISRIVRRFRRAQARRAAEEAARSAGEEPEEQEATEAGEPLGEPSGVPLEPPGAESKGAEAGEKAINIRLDKLNSPEDVIDLVRQTAKTNAARIHFQRRGRLVDAELKKRMETVGLDAEKLSKLPRGKALNEAEIEVAIGIMQNEGEKIRDAQREVQKSNSAENILRAQELHNRYVAIQAAVSGITAEAGRSLRTFRRIHEALDRGDTTNYERVIDALGGRKLSEEEAKRLLMIPENDRMGYYKFLRDHARFTTGQKLMTYWINNLLSSPRTPLRKLMGDATMVGLNVPKTFVRAAVETMVAPIQGRPREYYFREAVRGTSQLLKTGFGFKRPDFQNATSIASAFFNAFPEGMKRGAFVLAHGFDMQDAEEMDLPYRYELPGGYATNFPTRNLAAATAMFKTMHFKSTLAAEAMREALRTGLRGKAAGDHAAELFSNPPDDMVERSWKEARKLALVEDPDSFLRAVLRMRNVGIPEQYPVVGGLQPLRFVIPFVNIGWNIGKMAMRYSPVGAARMFRSDVRTGPEASNVLAEALIGSLILAAFAAYAAKGNITGAPPRSPAQRDAFQRAGKQSYSIKIGNRWVRYTGAWGVMAPALASIAAWHDSHEQNQKLPESKQISQVAATIGAAMTDQPLFRGLQSINEAITNPSGSPVDNFLAEAASGFIPASSLLRTTAQSIDPAVREPEGVYERIKAGLPLLSQTLPQRVDVLGRGETYRGSEGAKAFLPSPIPEAEPLSEVDAELGRLQEKGLREIGAPGQFITVQNTKIPLSRAQQNEYARLRGTLLRESLRGVFADPDYQAMDDQSKIKEAQSVIRQIDDYARDNMIGRMVEEMDKREGVPTEP